jgi:hypothetical protein
MGPGTGRSGGPRATPADTLRALAGDISEYLGPDALTAIARGLVEDAPGWEYADVLPRAVNRETGERSWAAPGMARDVAKGLWELMQGPYMEPGQNLSPEAVLSLPALAVPAGAALAPRGAIGMFAGRNAKGIAPEDMIVLNRGGGVQASMGEVEGAASPTIARSGGAGQTAPMRSRITMPRPDMMPVRLVDDPSLSKYDTSIRIGDNGVIEFAAPNAKAAVEMYGPLQMFSEAIQRELFKQFQPKYDHFWRFTNNRKEPLLVRSGEIRPSYNYADNFSEKGLSVATGPEYSIHGYPYGYGLRGEVIGSGSDGEPVLRIGTIEPVTKLMRAEEIVARDNQEAARIRQARGWLNDYIKAMWFKPYTEDEYARFLTPIE